MDTGTHARDLFVFVWLCLTHQPKGDEFVGEDAKLSQNKGASGPTDGSAAVPRAAWLQMTAASSTIPRMALRFELLHKYRVSHRVVVDHKNSTISIC